MEGRMSEEASTSRYTLTFKAGTAFSDPWIVVRAETIEEAHDAVKELTEGALFATVGVAAKDFHAAYQLGKQLGAEPTSPPKSTKTRKASSKAKEEPKAEEEAKPEEAPATEEPKAKPATTGRPKPAWKS